jgi:hypothetical protein
MGSVYAYSQREARFFTLFAIAKAPALCQKRLTSGLKADLSGCFGRRSPEPPCFPEKIMLSLTTLKREWLSNPRKDLRSGFHA